MLLWANEAASSVRSCLCSCPVPRPPLDYKQTKENKGDSSALHDLYMSPGSRKSLVKMTGVLSKEDLGKARLRVLNSISAASGGSVGRCRAGAWGLGCPSHQLGGHKSGRARMQHRDCEPSPRLLLIHQGEKGKARAALEGSWEHSHWVPHSPCPSALLTLQ